MNSFEKKDEVTGSPENVDQTGVDKKPCCRKFWPLVLLSLVIAAMAIVFFSMVEKDLGKKYSETIKTEDSLMLSVEELVAKGDYKNDLRRYFHIAHVTDFTGTTLCNVVQQAGFKVVNYDKEVNGLFVADKTINWSKNENDSIDNILKIENTYKGTLPHL